MTKVDFYLLGTGGDNRERIACRLAEKAWRLGNRVYLLAPDKPAALELDELLWTFSQGSFVPHALCTTDCDAQAHPVLIGDAEPPDTLHDVLISLAADVPTWFSRFARVAEVIGTDEEDKARGRERFRYYRERGYPLETHNL
jgi:DNA polymerase III subunit chi